MLTMGLIMFFSHYYQGSKAVRLLWGSGLTKFSLTNSLSSQERDILRYQAVGEELMRKDFIPFPSKMSISNLNQNSNRLTHSILCSYSCHIIYGWTEPKFRKFGNIPTRITHTDK